MSNVSVSISDRILRDAKTLAAREGMTVSELASAALTARVMWSKQSRTRDVSKSRKRLKGILDRVKAARPVAGDEMPGRISK